jgi:O-antigen/teichoic acid export membrane protein
MSTRRGIAVGLSGVRPSAATEIAPPVSPNLVEEPELQKARGVGRNTFETVLFRGVSTPLALLFVVLQSRLLEPEGRGEFVVVVLGATIVGRLLGQLGVAVTSRMRRAPVPVSALTQRALALGATLAAVFAPAMVGLTALSGQVSAQLALIGALGIYPNVVWQTISGVLLGQGRLRLWNVIQLISPALSLVGLLVFCAGLGAGVGGALVAWMLAHVVAAGIALAATRELWWPARVRGALDSIALELGRLAIVMGAVQVVNLVAYRAELFVLGRELGNTAVGIYSIALQAVDSMWLVPAAIATAVTAPVVAAPDDAAAARLVRRASVRALGFAALVAAAVGVIAPWLIPAVFGSEFEGSVRPLELLLPGVVIYAPVTVLVVYISIRHAKPWLSLGVSIVAGLVTVGSALVLIPAYGSSGAGLASTIGYAAGGAAAWIFFERLRRASR